MIKVTDIETANTVEDLKGITSTIQLDDKPVFDKYFTKLNLIYPYYLNYGYNVLSNQWNVRFAEVEFDGDTVLFAYKRISLFSVKFYRILFYPISISGNKANADAVFNEIIKYDEVTEIVTREPNGKMFDRDFYIDATEKFQSIDNCKFRSKHRINILQKDPSFKIRRACINDKTELQALINNWKIFKGKSYGGSVFKGVFKHFDTIIDSEDFEVLVMTYADNILCVCIYVNTTDDNYYQIVNIAYNKKHLPPFEQTEMISKILSDMSQIYLYFNLDWLHTKVGKITFAGGRKAKLIKYKEREYKNFVPYYRKQLDKTGIPK